jgi:hypothetical protein
MFLFACLSYVLNKSASYVPLCKFYIQVNRKFDYEKEKSPDVKTRSEIGSHDISLTALGYGYLFRSYWFTSQMWNLIAL